MNDPAATGDGPLRGALARCVACGTPVPTPAPADWTLQRTEAAAGHPGALEHLCPACTRANVRAIEAKLPPDWW